MSWASSGSTTCHPIASMILHLKQQTKKKTRRYKIQQIFSGKLNAVVAGILFFQTAHNPSPNQDDHDGIRPNCVVVVLDPSWKAVVSLDSMLIFHVENQPRYPPHECALPVLQTNLPAKAPNQKYLVTKSHQIGFIEMGFFGLSNVSSSILWDNTLRCIKTFLRPFDEHHRLNAWRGMVWCKKFGWWCWL